MPEMITPEIYKKLEEIGFEEYEISTFQMIHELKTRKYEFDIKQLINRIAFDNLSEGIAETFENNKWTEENFFDIVETYRKENLRVVIDTNILFSALNPKSRYYPIIENFRSERFSLPVSTDVLLEYEEILQRVFLKGCWNISGFFF
ncbi:MAG: PIN domain-containing protein [Desulfococcaceae bacterium]